MLKTIFPISFSNLPTPIKIIGTYFLITPIVSYIATAYKLDLPLSNVKMILASFDKLNIILNLMGFLVGIGILGVKKWGYFVFLTFNSALIIHGIYLLVRFNGIETEVMSQERLILNLIITILPFFLILYFLNSEISTPYLTLVPRGFRKKWRTEIPIKGFLLDSLGNKLNITTLDVSPTGCLAEVDGYIADEDDFALTFDLEKDWRVSASVVRIQNENVGLRFNYNGTNDPAKKELKNYLESKLHPRYDITIPCDWSVNGQNYTSDILNISEGGLFLSTNESAKIGDNVSFSFKLLGFRFSGTGSISWINSSAKYNKPVGIGISFNGLKKNILYNFIISGFRLFAGFQSRER
ncbi:MAG TPA: PilZ domain-containing protein [Leptospiraceae bacterium]|nr:PilZ domain-containing protein [Leptospiraceae bacterium]HMX34919.1 PilZ domain-containing protein [Leptospiraceae bacterium]HMY30425.1 PilZ domain-containing protein [Leptospiraceae bacterium]HMZ64659.1 PilZ domain-containing protein [Leptospiraceae bacterium]HNA09364.1 PilZ domain-containing protein [Leptospiraceae bacterium]